MTVDDVIALNPTAERLRHDAREELRDLSTREMVPIGLYVVEARTGGLCGAFFHLLPPEPRYVRLVVQNGMFTAVAFWLQLLGPQLSATTAELDSATQLLTDLWTTIAGKREQPIDEVASMLIRGYVVATGLRDAYEGRPLLRHIDRDLTSVLQSHVFASVRRCGSLLELVREARSQLLA